MTELVLPLGHYLGYQAPDHWVRFGQRTAQLRENTAAAWMLAHGEPASAGAKPWTRAEIAPVADGVDSLIADGMLAEIDPESAAAEQFARRHRLRPLLSGLGAHPELPGTYAIGLPGEALAIVPRFVYDVWQFAPVTNSIWQSCELMAELEDELAEDEYELDLAEPGAVLTDLLYCLHLLLANHAVYLDES